AGDDHVGPRGGHHLDVVELDAPVDLEVHVVQAPLIEHPAQGADLRHHLRDEGLAAEARVDAHHQHQVHLAEHVLDGVGGRGGVEHHAGTPAGGADLLHHPVQVTAGLHVHRDQVGAGAGEVVDIALRLLDHEMDVEWALGDAAHRLHHQRADGDV